MLNTVKITLLATLLCGGALVGIAGAGVFVRTGPGGSVTVVTDGVAVQSGGGRSQVSVGDRSDASGERFHSHNSTFHHSTSSSSSDSHFSSQSNFVSQSSSRSVTRSSVDIAGSDLGRADYWLLVEGGRGSIYIDDRRIATLDGGSTAIRLDPYLSAGDTIVVMEGSGSASVRTAVVEVAPGRRPSWGRNGFVVGADRTLVQQNQSHSSGGSWLSEIDVFLY